MNIKKTGGEFEIDLLELLKALWSKRIFIFKVTGYSILLGLLIAFTSKVEYSASCRLLPENGEGAAPNLGGLSGLAGIAGIDLSGMESGGTLSPDMYPEMVKSTPFVYNLMSQPIAFEKLDTTITSFTYFETYDRRSLLEFLKEYTVGLPYKLKSMFKEEEGTATPDYGFIRFSKKDWELIEEFSSRISISVDENTGIITVKSEMPDAIAAAIVANNLVEELTSKITSYKIEKAQQNLEFTSSRFDEAQIEYNTKQSNLARFTDRNRNITNPVVQIESERLQNELNVAFEVYKSLATQLEQAKIKVEEETPVFTVLEPVKVPVDKSKPKRGLIIIISAFFGAMISSLYVVIRISKN